MKTKPPDIRLFPPFTKMPASARRTLQKRMRKFVFSEGQLIIERKKRGQFFAIVTSGVLGLEAEDGTQYERLPGDWFGEEMLISDAPSKYRASARTNLVIWVLTRRDWLAAWAQTPRSSRLKTRVNWKKVKFWLTGFIFLTAAWLILTPELYRYSNQKLVGMLVGAERPDLAETYLNFFLKLKPDSPLEHNLLGYTHYLQGERLEALSSFLEAIRLEPDMASAQNNLGVVWLDHEKPDLAIDHFKKALDLDPGNSEVYFNLGNAQLKGGDYESAADSYRRAFNLDPGFLPAAEKWAECVMRTGDVDKARQAWLEVLIKFPGNAHALQSLGILDYQKGDGAAALANLEAARAADPNAAATYYYLGLTLALLDDPSQAAVEFERVLTLSDDTVLLDLAAAQLEILQK